MKNEREILTHPLIDEGEGRGYEVESFGGLRRNNCLEMWEKVSFSDVFAFEFEFEFAQKMCLLCIAFEICLKVSKDT